MSGRLGAAAPGAPKRGSRVNLEKNKFLAQWMLSGLGGEPEAGANGGTHSAPCASVGAPQISAAQASGAALWSSQVAGTRQPSRSAFSEDSVGELAIASASWEEKFPLGHCGLPSTPASSGPATALGGESVAQLPPGCRTSPTSSHLSSLAPDQGLAMSRAGATQALAHLAEGTRREPSQKQLLAVAKLEKIRQRRLQLLQLLQERTAASNARSSRAPLDATSVADDSGYAGSVLGGGTLWQRRQRPSASSGTGSDVLPSHLLSMATVASTVAPFSYADEAPCLGQSLQRLSVQEVDLQGSRPNFETPTVLDRGTHSVLCAQLSAPGDLGQLLGLGTAAGSQASSAAPEASSRDSTGVSVHSERDEGAWKEALQMLSPLQRAQLLATLAARGSHKQGGKLLGSMRGSTGSSMGSSSESGSPQNKRTRTTNSSALLTAKPLAGLDILRQGLGFNGGHRASSANLSSFPVASPQGSVQSAPLPSIAGTPGSGQHAEKLARGPAALRLSKYPSMPVYPTRRTGDLSDTAPAGIQLPSPGTIGRERLSSLSLDEQQGELGHPRSFPTTNKSELWGVSQQPSGLRNLDTSKGWEEGVLRTRMGQASEVGQEQSYGSESFVKPGPTDEADGQRKGTSRKRGRDVGGGAYMGPLASGDVGPTGEGEKRQQNARLAEDPFASLLGVHSVPGMEGGAGGKMTRPQADALHVSERTLVTPAEGDEGVLVLDESLSIDGLVENWNTIESFLGML